MLKYFYLHDKAIAMFIEIIIVDKDPKDRFKINYCSPRQTSISTLTLDAFYFIGAVYQELYIEERQFY